MADLGFLLKASKATRKDVRSRKLDISEISIEEAFVKFTKGKACTAFKLTILGRKGWPDRMVLGPNKLVMFVEFKKKGKTLSGAQTSIRLIIEKYGFAYHVCDEIGQAEAMLKEAIIESTF